MLKAIDTHTHFWPGSFLRSMHEGHSYLGFSAESMGGDRFVISGGSSPVKATLPTTDLADPRARIEIRDASQGVAMEAVMLSGFLWNYHLSEGDAITYAVDVNDELAMLQTSSAAHVGLAHIPLPHTKASIAEVQRCVADLGLRHFGVGTTFGNLGFDDPAIVPVLDAVAAAGATLSVHPVFFDTLGTPERLHSPFLRGGLASPMEAGLAMATIISSGVLDRYPEFRVWVSHGGGSAMYSMGRLDRRWNALGERDRPSELQPSEYLRRFWYGNLLHSDLQLGFLIDMVGADRVTIGTDFPFQWDHLGGSANWIRSHQDLSAHDREAILWRNAAEFLGVTPTWEATANG